MNPDHALFFRYHRLQHCCIPLLSPAAPVETEIFHFFPLLPPEIRLKIWQIVTQEPRVVELSCVFVSSNQQTGGQWFTHSPPPVIFSICCESRAVGLYEYELLKFEEKQIGRDWGTLYVNWENDCIWLCNDLSATWAKDLLTKNEQMKGKLKRLCIGRDLWKSLNPLMGLRQGNMAILRTKPTNVVESLAALESIQFHS